MGWFAMTAPAILVVPIATALRRWSHSIRWQSALEGTIVASAALVLATARSLLPDAVLDAPTGVVSVATLIAVSLTEIPTIWVILAGASLTFLWK